MIEAEVVSQLIGNIYDAALDPGLWTDTLEQATHFVGGVHALLYSKNVVARGGEVRYSWNFDSEAASEYFTKYVRLDPVTVGQYFFEVGDIYNVTDVMPYEEFTETIVYKEWAKPHGWVDHLAATLDKSATGFALFGVMRSDAQGLVDDGMRRRMQLLIPHMRRAILIGNVIDLQKSQLSTFSDTFDAFDAGVFLVDQDLRIVFANATAQQLLGDGQIFVRTQNALTACDAQAGRALRDIVTAASKGDNAIGSNGIGVPLSNSPGDNWLAHVLPLTSGARRQVGDTYAAVAAIFVRKVSLYTPLPIEIVAQLYKLTPGELRVLNALLNIGGAAKVSRAIGLSEGTVKTHLQHLFAKTGVRRQADLIKLVAAHADPFRASDQRLTSTVRTAGLVKPPDRSPGG